MIKRLLDVLLSGTGLLLLSPVFIVIYVTVVLNSGLPAFFRQVRVGRGGQQFRILKFRTMRVSGPTAGPVVTGRGDARITAIGRILRRTKLDELPQLVNVLLGHMSLVGPRPEVPKFVAFYTPEQRSKILSIRPGITDPASLEFIDEEALLAGAMDPEQLYVEAILPRKIRAYMAYVDNRSLLGDLRLIGMTIANVVRRASAR